MAFISIRLLLLSLAIGFVCFLSYPSLVEWGYDTSSKMEEKKQNTVIVIGGGLSGLSAAIEAHKAGAKVVIIEREGRFGGNSAKASSGMNAVQTPSQKAHGVEDSPQLLVDDTLHSGHGHARKDLVEILSFQSTAAESFLREFGIELTELVRLGGHSRARTIRAPFAKRPTNVGNVIIQGLLSAIKDMEGIELRNGTRVTEIVTKEGKIVGVKATTETEQLTILGDSIVLATGGYGASSSLLGKYVPHISHLPTTNGEWADGSGILLAEQLGAGVMHMDFVQVHPTGIIDPKAIHNPSKFLAGEALRGVGGILVNSEGHRFVDEMGLRDHVSAEIFKNCKPLEFVTNSDGTKTKVENGPVVSYLIVTTKAAQVFPPFAFYKFKGFATTHSNFDTMANFLNIDADVLWKTMEEYNEYAEKGEDIFGKTYFPDTFSKDEEYNVLMITPSIHYTMGGLQIDTQTRVYRDLEKGDFIENLFAAGEVTAGVHGSNRLGGNSLLECIVFGRIAGASAALA